MRIGSIEVYGIIYKITNKISKKVYIGITTRPRGFLDRYSAKGEGIERVYNYYTYQKKNNQFYNKHLVNSIEKYGFENFSVCEIFDIAFSKNELKIKEECWITIYKSNNLNYGYNRTVGGDYFLSGKDNPKFNRVLYNCDNCGKAMKLIPSVAKENHNHYCSDECRRKEGYSKFNSGKNNQGYKKKVIFCSCCGKKMEKPPSLIDKYKYNYCSNKCRINGYRETMLGENNPNFGNKGKVSYGKKWQGEKSNMSNHYGSI